VRRRPPRRLGYKRVQGPVFPTCLRNGICFAVFGLCQHGCLAMTVCLPWPQECDPVVVPSEDEAVTRPATDPLLQPPPASGLQQLPENERPPQDPLRP
jgi:hypothetical protein